MKGFEVAGGSLIGAWHRAAGKNNQDAYCSVDTGPSILAVVADGCGSAPASEVGSHLITQMCMKWIPALLRDWFSGSPSPEPSKNEFWRDVSWQVTRDMKTIAECTADPAAFAHDHLLSTVLGALVFIDETIVFGLGDGEYVVNGQSVELGPFANNAPPYLAYGIDRPDDFQLGVHAVLPTSEIDSLIIATDGVADVKRVESLNAFVQDDCIFANPDMLRRRLFKANGSAGRLKDDTTLVIIRKTKAEGG